ncbi:8-amino-7-oxononanoate synthase [Alkalihalobacillus sp. LMS39]|uniref:8-amino-7-oxononanoate synthase n=1 Tax=Alkalihalobacillus sp. LMS39 TaxID=2924032 RepID=UPI001FB5133C|nr:8-amino-7-oxononanoate synthase [Alkalihalobacillus sp. LMS39]UOE95333.1 8-amino-7-oxononanoate synthase [Alkalihalobacillus sp. LMS39]
MNELDAVLKQKMNKTIEAGLYRHLQNKMNTAPKPKMIVNQKELLVFSSNDYLGLANDKRLIEAAHNVMNHFGVGSSGSRLTTGNTEWHEKLEQKIASFKQTEAALLFSSGYLANVGVLTTLPQKGDIIFSDELNHASIIDGCRLSKAETVIYRHIDMNDLEEKLRQTEPGKQKFIVTDGVFSMDGTIAPLSLILSLAKKYGAFLIVDDAHATGVLGENGRGTSEYFGVEPHVVIGTLSKAVGGEGGFVAGSAILIDYLINHARTFIFQTALPPASCATACCALEIIEGTKEKRDRLFANIRTVKEGLSALGFNVKGEDTPIIPVIIGEEIKAVVFAKKLMHQGIYAPAIRPPTVKKGESRIRLTVTSEHTREDIKKLLDVFQSIGRELTLIT